MKVGWILTMLGWVLAGAGAQAQRAPGSQAQVQTIVSSTAFAIPQVQLPNAAVARRINRWLLRYARSEFSTVDSAASPRRQLSQAARECCYDKDEKSG